MTRSHRQEGPDRLYVITSGRSGGADDSLDAVTLVVAESGPVPGMQSEHARILELCHSPMAVVEVSAHLRLPVMIVRILLTDLLDTGRITARHPRPAPSPARPLASPDVLEKVLVALHDL
ncbi:MULTISPECIES: DUF742 domain-containing protein [Nocardiopsis]|uniref:DUF742 domain-containing protein n=1 Tax=Nocardiopsis sinuspersici TaxID=501010 RepID=A0A1V3C0Q1_9ACTN|nr:MULTISPECIES: DUF742 domain-containing protein [Nocardiopsis]NYH50479.1 hypothetical protein [Nocardiopsis sinuspersici]OOC54381.1 hypothetical protein NOSIN_11660 [Nocardiopsis sinuspersici]